MVTGGRGDLVLNPDGTLVLAHDGRALRVYEVVTGQPVTPALSAAGLLVTGLGFGPDGRRVGAVEGRVTPDGHIELVGREWDLGLATSPAEAARAARVAAGREPDAAGGLVVVPADRQQADWAAERAARGDPAWTPAQVRDWHMAGAAEAENYGRPDWRAAAFHLGVLAAQAPDDEPLRKRMEQAVRNRDAGPPKAAPAAPPKSRADGAGGPR
jgi:hypothetical protein